MTSDQGWPGTPQGSPGTPGREAEDVPVDGPGDTSKVDADLDALVADVARERDEYLELAKRTQADFENYRKRMAAEVQAAATRGKAELATQVVGVIDTLERALEAAGVESVDGPAPEEPLAEGFFLTYRELLAALQRAGVEAFDPAGEKFDPTLHEALSSQPFVGVESGIAVETMQKGYRLGEQLIRPARVVVSE